MTEREEAPKEVEVTAEETLTDVDLDEDTAATEEDDVGDMFDAEGTDEEKLRAEQTTDDSLSAVAKNLDGLDMREIHRMVREMREQQRELDHERKTILNMKRAIIFLCAFTLALTLAMLGVSFVAARLAKDTTVIPGTHALADKASGETLSTISASRTYRIHYSELENEDENETEEEGGSGRRLFAPSSSSLIEREIQRRVDERREEKKQQQQGRKLYLYGSKSFGNLVRGSTKNNGNGRNRVSTSSRNSVYSGGSSAFSSCLSEDNYVGEVTYRDYKTMTLSARNGGGCMNFETENEGLYYTYSRVCPNNVLIAGSESSSVGVFAFDDDNSECTYVVDNCRWTSSRRRIRARSSSRIRSGAAARSQFSTFNNDPEQTCSVFRCCTVSGDTDGFDSDSDSDTSDTESDDWD